MFSEGPSLRRGSGPGPRACDERSPGGGHFCPCRVGVRSWCCRKENWGVVYCAVGTAGEGPTPAPRPPCVPAASPSVTCHHPRGTECPPAAGQARTFGAQCRLPDLRRGSAGPRGKRRVFGASISWNEAYASVIQIFTGHSPVPGTVSERQLSGSQTVRSP